MSVALRDRQLQALCDVLDTVSADAPTLCRGWSAHDLAVHLWILKRDPLGWPGVVVPRLDLGRSARIRRRWTYEQLTSLLRKEPGAIACMPCDRREDFRHSLGEYWMHTQDVARPNQVMQTPPSESLQDELWLRVQKVAATLHRRRTPGLVLSRPGRTSVQVTAGPPRIVLSGEPSELMCWVHGRTTAARVTVTAV